MFETQQLYITSEFSEHHLELLRLAITVQQLKQAQIGEGKTHKLRHLALAWLDRWIVSLGEQAQGNPDPYYPYFWSGPGSMMFSSRFGRFM